MINVFGKQLCNMQDNVWWAIHYCISPWGLLSIMTRSLRVCFTWQPVADQTLVLLLPVISQSSIITACFNWLWMQGNITYWHSTYWRSWRLTDVQVILSVSLSWRNHSEQARKWRIKQPTEATYNVKDPLATYLQQVQIWWRPLTITHCSVSPQNILTKSDRNGAVSPR